MQNEELEPAFRQTQLANLSRAGRHFHTLSANLNRQDPEIGRRYGVPLVHRGIVLEARAEPIEEGRCLPEGSFQFFI